MVQATIEGREDAIFSCSDCYLATSGPCLSVPHFHSVEQQETSRRCSKVEHHIIELAVPRVSRTSRDVLHPYSGLDDLEHNIRLQAANVFLRHTTGVDDRHFLLQMIPQANLGVFFAILLGVSNIDRIQPTTSKVAQVVCVVRRSSIGYRGCAGSVGICQPKDNRLKMEGAEVHLVLDDEAVTRSGSAC